MTSKFKPRIGMKTVSMQGYSSELNAETFWFDAGARISLVGDSITQYNNGSQTGVSNMTINTVAVGEFASMHMLDPRFNMDVWAGADTYDSPHGRSWYGANQGYAGQTSATILSRLPNVLEHPSEMFIYSGGTNDGSFATTSVTNAKAILAGLVAAGKKGAILPIRPRQVGGNTGQGIIDNLSYNAQMKAWVELTYPGVVDYVDIYNPYDLWDGVADNAVATPQMLIDGLHPSNFGAWIIAQVLNNWLRTRVRPGNTHALNPNAETLPVFSGSGGTSGHANITGVIPAGWTVDFSNGNTALVVCSVVSGKLVLDITPGAVDSTIRVRRTTNIVSAVGDWWQMQANISTTGTASAKLEDNTNPTNYYNEGIQIAAARSGTGYSTTAPYQARSTGMRPGIRTTASASTAAYQVTVNTISCKKITDPKVTWGAGLVPLNLTPPVISGTPTQPGQVMSVISDTWDNRSVSTTMTKGYRWYRNGVFIGNSTGAAATYTTVAGDAGTTLTVGMSGANSKGRGAETISAGVAIT